MPKSISYDLYRLWAVAILVVAVSIGSLSAAWARPHHHHGHHWRHHHVQSAGWNCTPGWWNRCQESRRPARQAEDGRPADCYGIAWCGCYLRHVLGVAGKEFNLAIHWLHWGRPSGPQVGAVAIGPHHVALLKGAPDANGYWHIQDGNDGPVRLHRRDIHWAHWFRLPS